MSVSLITEGLVRAEGLEPPRLSSLEPKSSASTVPPRPRPGSRWNRKSAPPEGAPYNRGFGGPLGHLALVKPHIPELAEFAPDLGFGADMAEAHGEVQAHRAFVRQGDAAIGAVDVFVLQGFEQGRIKSAANALPDDVRREIDAGRDRGFIRRFFLEAMRTGIAYRF